MAVLETPSDLHQDDNRRPYGSNVLNFENGRPFAWNATIITPPLPVICGRSPLKLEREISTKRVKKAKYRSPYSITVMISAHSLLKFYSRSAHRRWRYLIFDAIAHRICSRTDDSRARTRLVRHIAAAVQSGNSALIPEAQGFRQAGPVATWLKPG